MILKCTSNLDKTKKIFVCLSVKPYNKSQVPFCGIEDFLASTFLFPFSPFSHH